jgi:hypothetical protein
MLNDDGGILLNLNNGSFCSLNRTGARALHTINASECGIGVTDLVSALQGECREDVARLEADVRAFLRSLEIRGYLRTTSGSHLASRGTAVVVERREPRQLFNAAPVPDSAPIRRENQVSGSCTERQSYFSTMLDAAFAFVGLTAVGLILKFGGFPSLHRIVTRWATSKQRIPRRDTVARVCRAVELAAGCYMRQALCLQEAAVTTCLLRWRGVPAEMVIGARKMPFFSHAWVELRGEIVFNPGEWDPKMCDVLERC